MFDLIIRGGRVVTLQGDADLEIGVSGEKIAALAAPGALPSEGARVLDVQGKIVVPGGIEPHCHIGQTHESVASSAGPLDTSRGVAFGGVTTIFDFCNQRTDVSIQQAIEERKAVWQRGSYIDYGFHVMLRAEPTLPESVIREVPDAVKEGFTSVKMFATHLQPAALQAQRKLDFGEIWQVFEALEKSGGTAMVHAEDNDIVQYMYRKMTDDGTIVGKSFNNPLIHNGMSEDMSYRRVIRLAEVVGNALYFVHTTGREGVAALAEARAKGLPINAETLHSYLVITTDDYKDPLEYKKNRRRMDGNNFPGAKYAEDREALWQGLIGGALSTVGTDQSCLGLADKLATQTPESWGGGHNGAESRMGIVYTEGVVKRGMSLKRFVEVTSENAARIFDLYPRKGAIAVGSDADLAVIDPTIHKNLTMQDLHLGEYSVWEGQEVRGWPVTTVLRGKVIVENGKLHGSPTDGQLLLRKGGTPAAARSAAPTA